MSYEVMKSPELCEDADWKGIIGAFEKRDVGLVNVACDCELADKDGFYGSEVLADRGKDLIGATE